jgi:hypothetical protein
MFFFSTKSENRREGQVPLREGEVGTSGKGEMVGKGKEDEYGVNNVYICI